MASVTLSITESLQHLFRALSWVNWSELAREEARKKLILENYLRLGTISDAEWKFCEKIDWHPVDQLPLKEEFVQEMNKIKQEKAIKLKSIADLFKNLN